MLFIGEGFADLAMIKIESVFLKLSLFWQN